MHMRAQLGLQELATSLGDSLQTILSEAIYKLIAAASGYESFVPETLIL